MAPTAPISLAVVGVINLTVTLVAHTMASVVVVVSGESTTLVARLLPSQARCTATFLLQPALISGEEVVAEAVDTVVAAVPLRIGERKRRS